MTILQLTAHIPMFLLCVLGLLFSACSENSSGPDNAPDQEITLTSQSWKLVSLEEISEGREEPVKTWELYTASFGNDTIRGVVGCNSYTGRYERSGDQDIAINDVIATDSRCDVHSTAAAFLAGLDAARTLQITGDTLRMVYAAGTKALRFVPATTISEVALDIDNDGEEDFRLIYENQPSYDIVTQEGLEFYDVVALNDSWVLGGVGDSGIQAAPLLSGMSINNQPIPPFTWQRTVRLAERRWTLTRPGFWGGAWANGNLNFVGVAVMRNEEPYFGWLKVQLMVEDTTMNLRLLDYFIESQALKNVRAGVR